MTTATPGAPPVDEHGRPTVSTRPRWANPWAITFILGCIALTLVRDRTRHVPEPPLDQGKAPVAAFAPAGGPSGVRVYAFVQAGEDGKRAGAALGDLAGRIREAQLPVTPVALVLPGVATAFPAPIVTLPASEDAVRALHDKLASARRPTPLPNGMPTCGIWWTGAAADCGRPIPPLREVARHGLILVDSQDGLRGTYDLGEQGIDEAMHRAAHVLRLERRGF